MMPPMVSLDRERLRAIIAQRGTTPRAVSRAIGSNDTLLRDILSGKSKNARGDTMAKIADHLGVALRDFYIGIDGADESEAPSLCSGRGKYPLLSLTGGNIPHNVSLPTRRRPMQTEARIRSAEADYALAARERFETPAGSLVADLNRVEQLAIVIRQTAETLAGLYADLEFGIPNGTGDDTDQLAGLIADAMESHASGEANRLISAHLLKLAGRSSFFPVARHVVGVAA